MKVCEYANNLFDMGLLVYLADKDRRIVYKHYYGDYNDILNVDHYEIYISLFYTIDYNTTHGKKTVVKRIKEGVEKDIFTAEIIKIHGILPEMSIIW
ncbi:MAG: hypothetical protein ACP5JU_03775 [Minisyncoccia bacterium]